MEEKIEVKVVESTENVSTQEKEAAILQEAINSGEVDSKYGFQNDGVYRVNIDSPPKQKENAVQEQETTRVSVGNEPRDSEKVDQEVRVENTEESVQEKEIAVLEEIVDEVIIQEKQEKPESIIQPSQQEQQQQIEYPENIQKLVDFMKDTGVVLKIMLI